MEKEQQGNSPVFVNEKTVFRIAMLANIVSWIILAIYVLNFGSNLYQMFSMGQFMMPALINEWISLITSVFYTLVIGLVYFAVLQGVNVGLNLGMDMFYSVQPAEDEKTAE